MAPRFCTTQRNSCINPPTDILKKQDELVGAPERSNAGSNGAPTPLEAPTSPLVSPPFKDLFTKFIKVFMETRQAQGQVLAEPREHPLKARTPETYWSKSHMECYHFYQQYEDYFEKSDATRTNHTPFVASFFCGSISLRWA